MYTANELKIRGLADELLKETIRLVAEKCGDSSDEDHPGKKDCIGAENCGHGDGSAVDGVKITDVRTTDITEEQKEECNKSVPPEQCESIKKTIDQSLESQSNGICSNKQETHAVTESHLEPIPVSMLLYVSLFSIMLFTVRILIEDKKMYICCRFISCIG
jgi:hypothetical protein